MLCGSSHFYYSVTVSLENLEWKSEVENPFEFSVQNAVMSPIAMLGTENNIYFVGQCNRRMQHGVITSCFFQIHFNITLLYTHNSTSPKFLFYIFPKVFCNFFSFLLCILYDPPISSAITSSLLISSDQYISWSPLCCHFHPPVTFSPLCPNVPASTLLHSLSLCSDLVMTSFHIHTKQQVDITTIFYIPTSFGAKTLTKESITAHGTYPPPSSVKTEICLAHWNSAHFFFTLSSLRVPRACIVFLFTGSELRLRLQRCCVCFIYLVGHRKVTKTRCRV